jgi:hypothetical protein
MRDPVVEPLKLRKTDAESLKENGEFLTMLRGLRQIAFVIFGINNYCNCIFIRLMISVSFTEASYKNELTACLTMTSQAVQQGRICHTTLVAQTPCHSIVAKACRATFKP